jgi:hypothetical protein
MFSYLRVVGTSNRSTKLQNHCAMCLRKLLIGLFFLPLFTSGGPTLTPADAEGRADGAAKLRALIEGSPNLLLEQTDLVIKLPKGQELDMVSWLARDATTGVTWLIQRGDKADPVIAVDQRAASCARLVKDCTRFHTRSGSTQRQCLDGRRGEFDRRQKFSPKGKNLLKIDVGGQLEPAISPFRGATDIALLHSCSS